MAERRKSSRKDWTRLCEGNQSIRKKQKEGDRRGKGKEKVENVLETIEMHVESLKENEGQKRGTKSKGDEGGY